MAHDKSLHDGKKKRDSSKNIKEKRAEKRARQELGLHTHMRNKPRWAKEPHG